MAMDILSIGIGFAAGGVVAGLGGAALLLPRIAALRGQVAQQDAVRAAMEQTFVATAQQALDRNSEQFMKLAAEKLASAHKDGAHDLEKRQLAINELLKPVQKQLETLGSTVEQIKGTDQALREDLKHLSRETARLAGALRDPAAQGRWGEFILEGLLDKSGLIKGVHYDTQVSFTGQDGQRQRPDAIIRMQDGLSIIVDAKAPLNEFADRMGDNLSPEEFAALTANLARQVRNHITALGRKGYWESPEFQTPDFTVMFLPSEHLFSMALRADPTLADYAMSQNVIISSPTLFMALLRVIGFGWKQGDIAQNAQKIAAQGAELYKRLATFAGHLQDLGSKLRGASDSYNSAIGSLERNVLSSTRRLKDMGVETAGKDLPEMAPVQVEIRSLGAPELLGPADNDAEKLEKSRAKG
jgi:DNA recombination protein RmuC